MSSMGGRLLRLAALGSQLLNVILFDGSPDETISGRSYRQGVLKAHEGWDRARRIINKLFFWQEDHCRLSHEQDLRFARTILSDYEKGLLPFREV